MSIRQPRKPLPHRGRDRFTLILKYSVGVPELKSSTHERRIIPCPIGCVVVHQPQPLTRASRPIIGKQSKVPKINPVINYNPIIYGYPINMKPTPSLARSSTSLYYALTLSLLPSITMILMIILSSPPHYTPSPQSTSNAATSETTNPPIAMRPAPPVTTAAGVSAPGLVTNSFGVNFGVSCGPVFCGQPPPPPPPP